MSEERCTQKVKEQPFLCVFVECVLNNKDSRPETEMKKFLMWEEVEDERKGDEEEEVRLDKQDGDAHERS